MILSSRLIGHFVFLPTFSHSHSPSQTLTQSHYYSQEKPTLSNHFSSLFLPLSLSRSRAPYGGGGCGGGSRDLANGRRRRREEKGMRFLLETESGDNAASGKRNQGKARETKLPLRSL